MPQITNRQKRAFIFAQVPNPEKEGETFPAVVANPGETVPVPGAHLAELRKHSAQIFDHLFDGRHLMVAGRKPEELRADELENTASPVAPDELAIDPMVQSKGVEVSEVDIDGAPAEAPRANRRRA